MKKWKITDILKEMSALELGPEALANSVLCSSIERAHKRGDSLEQILGQHHHQLCERLALKPDSSAKDVEEALVRQALWHGVDKNAEE